MKNQKHNIPAQSRYDIYQLPSDHANRFKNRLKNIEGGSVISLVHPTRRSKKNMLQWSIAASIAIIIGLTGFIGGQMQSRDHKKLSPALAAAQDHYSNSIELQLSLLNKLQSPENERIIADAKLNLKKLEADYQKIIKDFQSNSDNPAVIDAMIQNLKTRILLLENARAQINTSNQQLKKNTNELL